MNLMMYCDSGYSRIILVTLESFFEFHPSEQICFYAFGRKWTDNDKNQLSKYLTDKNSEFVYVEVSGELSKIPYQNGQIAIFFSWIFAPRIIKSDKVLCIDNDILFNGSIKELYEKEMGNDCVYGVLDWNNQLSKIAVGLEEEDIYINSGFKLLNLSRLREIDFEKKAIQFIANYKIERYKDDIRHYLNDDKEYWKLMYGNIGYVYFHDQGTLAKVLQGRIRLIDPKYNVTRFIMDEPLPQISRQWGVYYSEEQILDAKYRPVVIHFAGGARNKPWKIECDHPYCDMYRHYAVKLGIDVVDHGSGRKKFRKSEVLKFLPGFVASWVYKSQYHKLSKKSGTL